MFQLDPEFPDATPEQKWDQFRIYRNRQLTLTDWTQTLDCPLSQAEKDQYASYRNFLRTAPNLYETVEMVDFPSWVEVRDYRTVLVESPYRLGN